MFSSSFTTYSVDTAIQEASVWKLRKFEIEVSDRCKMLRTDTWNDFIQCDVGFMTFGSKVIRFLKMNNMYWY